MNYQIDNLTSKEIHRLWQEMSQVERAELFDQLVELAESKEIELSTGQKEQISETTEIKKTENGFILRSIDKD